MLQIFLTFVITILIAYLFGIILVNLIDNRLNKLKINTEEHYSNKKEKKEDDKKIIEYKTYNFDTGKREGKFWY
jgi:phosphate/sulfate permease